MPVHHSVTIKPITTKIRHGLTIKFKPESTHPSTKSPKKYPVGPIEPIERY